MNRVLWLRFSFGAAALLAALATLWRFRPEVPALPDSLSSPVTTSLLQQFTLVAAWLFAALVILLLFAESVRGIRARRRLNAVGTWHNRMPPSSRLRRVGTTRVLRQFAAEPSLLIAIPREAPPLPAEGAVTNTSEWPADAAAALDERPLVSLLGPFTVYGGKQNRRGLRARALELIAFLALRDEGAQRDEILEALWPGDDPKRSRHRLYQAVRDARRLLGDAVASQRDRYWLDRARVLVDVDELASLLDTVGRGDADRDSRSLEKALGLFREEPLSGSDFPWAEGDVRRLRGIYVNLLEQVGRTRLDRDDARGALDVAERGLAVDALHEGLWRLALEAEGELGLREAIDDRYQRLRTLLEERLGLEPERKTRALYLDLLAQD